eukprot:166609-Amphidinium_carterae.1
MNGGRLCPLTATHLGRQGSTFMGEDAASKARASRTLQAKARETYEKARLTTDASEREVLMREAQALEALECIVRGDITLSLVTTYLSRHVE